MDRYAYFLHNACGVVCKQSQGVVRTNCIDCLDRTNVLQGILARKVCVCVYEGGGGCTPTALTAWTEPMSCRACWRAICVCVGGEGQQGDPILLLLTRFLPRSAVPCLLPPSATCPPHPTLTLRPLPPSSHVPVP